MVGGRIIKQSIFRNANKSELNANNCKDFYNKIDDKVL